MGISVVRVQVSLPKTQKALSHTGKGTLLDHRQVLADFLGVGLEGVLHGKGRAAAKLEHRPVDHVGGKRMFFSQEAGGGR